jgi:hypothetical protein
MTAKQAQRREKKADNGYRMLIAAIVRQAIKGRYGLVSGKRDRQKLLRYCRNENRNQHIFRSPSA